MGSCVSGSIFDLPGFLKADPPVRREDAANQILSSIAVEELSQSLILNAEGKKMQYILGTLAGGASGASMTIVRLSDSLPLFSQAAGYRERRFV